MRKCIGRRLLASFFVVAFIISLNSLVFETLSKYCILEQKYERDTVQRQFPAEIVMFKDALVDSMIQYLRNSSFVPDKFWTMGYMATREVLRYNLTGAEYLFTTGKTE